MISNAAEVGIGRQHCQAMTNAKLRQQRVYRSDLNAGPAARISQVRSTDVIFSVGNEKRNSGKTIQNLCPSPWPRKTLQQFLENETCRQQSLARFDRTNQRSHRRGLRRRVTPQSQRPNTGIDEQAQSRVRSAL